MIQFQPHVTTVQKIMVSGAFVVLIACYMSLLMSITVSAFYNWEVTHMYNAFGEGPFEFFILWITAPILVTVLYWVMKK